MLVKLKLTSSCDYCVRGINYVRVEIFHQFRNSSSGNHIKITFQVHNMFLRNERIVLLAKETEKFKAKQNKVVIKT